MMISRRGTLAITLAIKQHAYRMLRNDEIGKRIEQRKAELMAKRTMPWERR
jgi:hypothetical protein